MEKMYLNSDIINNKHAKKYSYPFLNKFDNNTSLNNSNLTNVPYLNYIVNNKNNFYYQSENKKDSNYSFPSILNKKHLNFSSVFKNKMLNNKNMSTLDIFNINNYKKKFFNQNYNSFLNKSEFNESIFKRHKNIQQNNEKSNQCISKPNGLIKLKKIRILSEYDDNYTGLTKEKNNGKKIFKFQVGNIGYQFKTGTDYYKINNKYDNYIIKKFDRTLDRDEYCFGLFSGHGKYGGEIASTIKDIFDRSLMRVFYTRESISYLFSRVSDFINKRKKLKAIESGSSIVLTYITGEKLICANCGVCRAIAINNQYKTINLSRDHTPYLLEEKNRIEQMGGQIHNINGCGPLRVWYKEYNYPGVIMTRSIGDSLVHKIGVSSTPDIYEYDLFSLNPIAIVLGSESIWQFLTNDDIKSIILKYLIPQNSDECAKEIVEKAQKLWEKNEYLYNDIICIVYYVNKI